MKLNKFNTKNLIDAGAVTSGVLSGGMLGHVGYSYLAPMLDKENNKPNMRKIARAGLMGVGLLVGAMVSPEDIVGKIIQSAGIGIAVTQGLEMIKDATHPEKGTFMSKALGLGSVDFSESYDYDNYSTAYNDYDYSTPSMNAVVPEYEGISI